MPASFRCFVLLVAAFLALTPAKAQKSAPPPGKSTGLNPPMNPFPTVDPTVARPLFVSGSVLFEGGISPQEPIPIQRVCNGALRREGYTDTKGQFQFELGRNVEQDASEGDSRLGDPQPRKIGGQASQSRFEGCELRALLPGFRSSSVILQ